MRKTSLVGYVLVILIFLLGLAAQTQAQGTAVSLPPCSTAVHDKYKTVGPDGQVYSTWHPVVDLLNGCFHDHEHGSNPAFAEAGYGYLNHSPNWPAFGYTAAVHAMSEGHRGFKVYIFTLQGVQFIMLHHFGTANAVGASCNEFHTLDLRARDAATGTLLADIHLIEDFGQSRSNLTNTALVPSACPDNPSRPNNGTRQLPIPTAGAPYGNGYEPWRIPTGPNVFGFDGKGLTINTFNPKTACDSQTCDVNIPRMDVTGPARGTYRNLLFYAGFGFAGSTYSGEFYTDPAGSTVVDASDPHAVKQYLAPGWTWTLATTQECYPFGADYFYQCDVPAVIRTKVDAVEYLRNVFVTGDN